MGRNGKQSEKRTVAFCKWLDECKKCGVKLAGKRKFDVISMLLDYDHKAFYSEEGASSWWSACKIGDEVKKYVELYG